MHQVSVCWVVSVVSNSLQPYGLWPIRLLCSWGFSSQEYWNGLPCPPSRDRPNPGIEPMSPELAAEFFTTTATWEAPKWLRNLSKFTVKMAELELKNYVCLTPFTLSKISIEHLLHARHRFRNCVHNSKSTKVQPKAISSLILTPTPTSAPPCSCLRSYWCYSFLGPINSGRNFPFRSNLGIIDIPHLS